MIAVIFDSDNIVGTVRVGEVCEARPWEKTAWRQLYSPAAWMRLQMTVTEMILRIRSSQS